MQNFPKSPDMGMQPPAPIADGIITYEPEKEREMALELIRDNDLNTMVNEIKDHDLNTFKHSQDVYLMAKYLTEKLGTNLSPTEIKSLLVSALLHDYGKIKVPASILNKPEKLTDDEFKEIEKHPEISYEAIIRWGEKKAISTNNPEEKEEILLIAQKAAESALEHHMLQAHPYPNHDNLKIDVVTKLLTAIDSFSAMTDESRPSNHGNIKKLEQIANELYQQFAYSNDRKLIMQAIMILEEYYIGKANSLNKKVNYSINENPTFS